MIEVDGKYFSADEVEAAIHENASLKAKYSDILQSHASLCGKIEELQDELRKSDLQIQELQKGQPIMRPDVREEGRLKKELEESNRLNDDLKNKLLKIAVHCDFPEELLGRPCGGKDETCKCRCAQCMAAKELKETAKRKDPEAMVWRACPEHKRLEKVPFKWGAPPWHPCPNCEYRNIVGSRETGPPTFTEKRKCECACPPRPDRLPMAFCGCPCHVG